MDEAVALGLSSGVMTDLFPPRRLALAGFFLAFSNATVGRVSLVSHAALLTEETPTSNKRAATGNI